MKFKSRSLVICTTFLQHNLYISCIILSSNPGRAATNFRNSNTKSSRNRLATCTRIANSRVKFRCFATTDENLAQYSVCFRSPSSSPCLMTLSSCRNFRCSAADSGPGSELQLHSLCCDDHLIKISPSDEFSFDFIHYLPHVAAAAGRGVVEGCLNGGLVVLVTPCRRPFYAFAALPPILDFNVRCCPSLGYYPLYSKAARFPDLG